jgi:hypothetical protein
MDAMGEGFADRICEGLTGEVEPMVRELAENVAFMHDKLESTRRSLDGEAVVVPYDNGGGQMGIRRNPAFEMYCSLLTQYRRSIDQLLGIMQKHSRDEGEGEGSTPLEDILGEAAREFADA